MAVAAACPTAGVAAGVDREPRVVEYRAQPRCRVVAGVARRREHSRFVIRIASSVVIGLMTAIAILGQTTVVAPLVAVVTFDLCVLSSEREACLTVVETRWDPAIGGMANFARSREATRFVIGAGRFVKVIEVTRHARCRQSRIHAILVARNAVDFGVLPGQWELGFIVIESRRLPSRGRVTDGAIGGETRRLVVWVGGTVVVLDVARRAICGCARVLATNMAT